MAGTTRSPETAIVAFSRGSSSGIASRLKDGRASEDDKKALILVPVLLLSVTVTGALALYYCYPALKKWREGGGGDEETSETSTEATPATTSAARTLGSAMTAEADFRSKANDRVLKNLGTRELNLDNLPKGAKIVNLPNQVGGHKMMKSVPALLLLEWEGKGAGGKSRRFVLKILHTGGRGLVELGFYEDLASHVDGPGSRGEGPQRTELAGYLCPYFGAVKVTTNEHEGEESETSAQITMDFLVLQDMCSGLDNPCALDVKMGRTTVEPGEREEKKIGQLRKYPNQPAVGFRYVGMSWSSFFEGSQQPKKMSMGKDWGAKMDVADTGGGLARFFYDGTTLRRGRVKSALRKIRTITNFFGTQKIFRFYASSLLLTYDSADPPPAETDAEEDVEVRMIDFAHAVPVDGDGADGEGPAEAPGDRGYLYGAKNLVAIMEELLDVTSPTDGPTELQAITAKLNYMATLKKEYDPVANPVVP